MSLELQITALAYLGLTALLSMIIGIDRQRTEKPAGLRTHMLAGIGACLFTMVGAMAFPNGDATRIASTVVTGIGFLGAGTIWHDNDTVKSLTTAASIWATAAVGVAVGAGAWLLAIGATVMIWFILAIVHNWEHRGIQSTDPRNLS